MIKYPAVSYIVLYAGIRGLDSQLRISVNVPLCIQNVAGIVLNIVHGSFLLYRFKFDTNHAVARLERFC
jgi:hypothetical protein